MNQPSSSPASPTTSRAAEAYENIRGGLAQIGAHLISTGALRSRSDELDRREKLLDEKESRFSSKESELEAIEEAITEKLLDFDECKRQLESIEGLISEKSKEFDSLRKREREAEEEWRARMEIMEREVVERLRSREESVNAKVDKLDRLAKNVEECVNEAWRIAREVELRERKVEELRKNVESKEKGVSEMEDMNKMAMDSVIKAADESAKALEERVASLQSKSEELKRKEMELKRQDAALKRCCHEPLEHAHIASSAKQPDSSTSNIAASSHPLNLEPIDDRNVSGILNGDNFKQNAHQNMDAIQLALEWKENIMGNTRTSVEGFAFLMFLATYGILISLNIDETVKLLGLVSQDKRALELCLKPNLAVGITDLVHNLIENKRLHEAVKYVGMFKLSDKFPIEPILKKYVQEAMKYFAATCGLRITPDEKVKVIENQIAHARGLVQCVKDHNLGSKHSSKVIEVQIALLEKVKEKLKCLLPDACPEVVAQKNQRKRKDHDSSISVTETLSQQARNLKTVFREPQT